MDAIDFLKGVEDVPIYWFEEPFTESREDSRKLKKWMLENRRKNTYYKDGEFEPDRELVHELIAERPLDGTWWTSRTTDSLHGDK